MDIFLQTWGGLSYLFAKIFLAKAEGDNSNLKLRIFGWFIYLLGIPAWVIVLALNHNWIAAMLEAGGAPTMIVAIMSNLKKGMEIPKKLDRAIKVLVFILILTGITYSVYDFGGITSLSQVLEFGVTVGYLIGTYLLTKKDRRGWLWFILMNTSMATLTAIQGKWIFTILQIVSLYFVSLGFKRSRI